MKEAIHYDIIADIHGRFDKLAVLMARLGYLSVGDSFIAPAGHRALFLGDLIDPKPGHSLPGGVRATLRAVKAMCDRGEAVCLMGNHELNAIYFHSKEDGRYLRVRGSKNVHMHQGTLDDFPDFDDLQSEWHREWIPWMQSLPFFLDLGGLRAVHAAWHPEMIARVAGRNLADREFFLACADKHSPEGEALEILLKGIEVPLPAAHSFEDHTGAVRRNFRARWWKAPAAGIHCCDLVFPASDQIPAVAVPDCARAAFQPYPASAPPVFFGHYFKPADSLLIPEEANVACIDHSGAKDGPLVAYRWKGEREINPAHYVTSQLPRLVFLHGLESGPRGSKFRALEKLDSRIVAPDCAGLKLIEERMAIIIAELSGVDQMVIVGSSFGGCAALLFAKENAHRIAACILCAPALNRLPENFEPRLPANTIVVHGRQDEVVPFHLSERFCQRNGLPLLAVDDDHRLLASRPLWLSLAKSFLIPGDPQRDHSRFAVPHDHEINPEWLHHLS